MSHIVSNTSNDYVYLMNVYIRENDKTGKDTINILPKKIQDDKTNEDHHHSYKMALQLLEQENVEEFGKVSIVLSIYGKEMKNIFLQ